MSISGVVTCPRRDQVSSSTLSSARFLLRAVQEISLKSVKVFALVSFSVLG